MDDVERLRAERDIYAVMTRYARGVDRVDPDLIRSCYHPDATDDHGSYRGDVEGFVTWVCDLIGSMEICQHVVNNFSVDVQGDRAVAETYMSSHARVRDDGGRTLNRITDVRFLDRLERRDGGPWLIARRTVVFDWIQVWPSEPYVPAGVAGAQGGEDPSAAFLADWRAETGSGAAWLAGPVASR
ncbi:MAG: nuclear transport factor 2 family protein [Acidimicrobiia bacterium]